MNKITRIILLVCLMPFFSGAFLIQHSQFLDESLIAHYSFNQCDARDDSGNGSDGRLMGGVSCWCGIDDDGLLFDGENDYVEFPGLVNNYFNTSDFTISFYFKTEQHSVFKQSMLSKRDACDEEHVLDFQLDTNNKEILTLVRETETKDYGNINPEIEKSGWHHVVLVREGIKAYTYINGQLHKTGRRCSGVDISNDALLSFANSPCIGRGGARRFKGILDELRIYDRAFSPEEVLLLYDLHPIENAASDCYT